MSWKHDVRAIHEIVVKKWPAWSPEDTRFLALALAGEVGELCNVIKKEWRGDFIFGKGADGKAMAANLWEEFADVRIYLELLSIACGVGMDKAVDMKLPELFRRWPEAAKRIKAGKCCVTHTTEEA